MIGFIIGLLVGGIFGVAVMCLCIVGENNENRNQR